jgi:hypothetical protein
LFVAIGLTLLVVAALIARPAAVACENSGDWTDGARPAPS